MDEKPIIVWMRRDLRLRDNPALAAACETGAPVAPVFILDEDDPLAPGGAARWWLHRSLRELAKSLGDRGAALTLRRGDSAAELTAFAKQIGARGAYWNRRYAAQHVKVDAALKKSLEEQGLEVRSFNGALLREPWELKTSSGGPYRVFTPFWRALQEVGPARPDPAQAPEKIAGLRNPPPCDDLASWRLQPTAPDWAHEFADVWRPGEDGAHHRLDAFLNGPVASYSDQRNRPDLDGTSRLSPHLAFGELSPLQVWTAVRERMATGPSDDGSATTFLSEIAWREFSYVQLYHNANLNAEPIRKEFDDFPWREDDEALRAWRRGETGYPIVDAGMRQLWRTGWMHNRVRMIVASFLVKHLLIPWRAGEQWFWDTLVDADPASNAASWQWVAGCGADAAPYFRIFNPITQGEKFDPEGAYTRRYAPELSQLEKKHLQKPWEAPQQSLDAAGVDLGQSYPRPIVDHMSARARALEAFETIKRN